jgi:hypothetical protein
MQCWHNVYCLHWRGGTDGLNVVLRCLWVSAYAAFLSWTVKQSLCGPGQAQWVPGGWGFQILRQSAHEGGEVSLAHRPPLFPRKYSWYSFLLAVEMTPGPQCGRKVNANEKFQWHHRESNPSFRVVAQCLDQLRYRMRPFFAVTHNGNVRILNRKFGRDTVPFSMTCPPGAEINIENTSNIIVKWTLLHQGQVVYGQHSAVLQQWQSGSAWGSHVT